MLNLHSKIFFLSIHTLKILKNMLQIMMGFQMLFTKYLMMTFGEFEKTVYTVIKNAESGIRHLGLNRALLAVCCRIVSYLVLLNNRSPNEGNKSTYLPESIVRITNTKAKNYPAQYQLHTQIERSDNALWPIFCQFAVYIFNYIDYIGNKLKFSFCAFKSIHILPNFSIVVASR